MKHCAPIMLRNNIFQKYCLYKTEKNKLMNFYFVYCNLKRFCVFWNLSDLNCISEREIQKILSEELKSIMWFFQKCLKAWQKKHWKMIYYMRKKNIYFFAFVFFEKTENSLLSHLPTTIYQQKKPLLLSIQYTISRKKLL